MDILPHLGAGARETLVALLQRAPLHKLHLAVFIDVRDLVKDALPGHPQDPRLPLLVHLPTEAGSW